MEIFTDIKKEKIIFHTKDNLAVLELVFDYQKQLYCASKTFVDASLRAQGIGELLYQSLQKYVLENKIKFYSTCSYVTKKSLGNKKINKCFVN